MWKSILYVFFIQNHKEYRVNKNIYLAKLPVVHMAELNPASFWAGDVHAFMLAAENLSSWSWTKELRNGWVDMK